MQINFRSMFDKIFTKSENSINMQGTALRVLNGYQDTFISTTNEPIYNDGTIRSCIHAIACNVAKLNPKHIRNIGNTIQQCNDNLDNLLAVRPNMYMNAYDFYYKLVSQLYLHNNAFVYIQCVNDKIVGLYPVPYNALELKEYNNEVYCKFYFGGGEQITLPYTSLIHLRRHYCNNDFFGDDANIAIKYNLGLLRTCKQGLENMIKNSAVLRGILKFDIALSPDDLAKHHKKFTDNYLDISKATGVATLDGNADFRQLTSDLKSASHEHLKFVEEEIYKYFNVSENILKSNYTEDEWNAFYESVIEPIAIQFSLEFTSKLFTEKEKGHGNKIVFEANRLQYASASTKYKMIKDLMPLGLFTVNEAREILNMAAIENGDKRQISLNYVDADNQNQYQLGINDGNDEVTKKDE